MRRLLIANRGEVAVRIARTADELGIDTVAVFAADDADALHVSRAGRAVALDGSGPGAYLDVDQVVAAAVQHRCDAIHPGYGLLGESPELARRALDAGLTFVGPSPEVLALFGDKTRARALAAERGIPILRGTDGPTDLAAAGAFLDRLGEGAAVMVKAVAGGGGRGMRAVRTPTDLAPALERAASEALAAFGDGSLYLEELVEGARHVEVQVVADGSDAVSMGDRECSLQRRRQKLVEVGPAVAVDGDVRERIAAWAVDLCRAVGYRGLCTVEFLVAGAGPVFIEANPRLQVEHTVTEEVTGLDLVALQLALADGATLDDVGLSEGRVPAPRGVAVQARVNLEHMLPDGSVRPTSGTLVRVELPSGPGVRIDTAAVTGQATSTRYDPLLAKVVVHSSAGLGAAVAKAERALGELVVEGVETNAALLRALLARPEVAEGDVDTGFVERHAAALAPEPVEPVEPSGGDDLGLRPTGVQPVGAHVDGTVVSVLVAEGDEVPAGAELVVIEAMKMEHPVVAARAGVVQAIVVAPGETIAAGQALVHLLPLDGAEVASVAGSASEVDPDHVRPDLAEVLERHRLTLDEARPDAVARRRATGQRTARENVEDLCDPGTFVEWGALTIAARRKRNTVEELIERTPADGLVMGVAHVNGDRFPEDRSRCAVLAYDYTVLAGTQGSNNHFKLDRMAELALRWHLPTVLFAEGGGGRPGDTEGGGFIRGFEYWGKLSGAVPLVGVVSGRCFAGNAALLGCCDVIIATADATLGMGGPAMVEGGGLGVFEPEEIGPIDVMQDNGVIDVLVADEAEAVDVARRYLSYFQGPVDDWECDDQRLLRHVIPENRVRAYAVRRVIDLIADTGSVLELRRRFGRAMVTALIRVEGRPVGVIANDPSHLGGAIDSDAADKAARFLQICEAFDLPVLSLSDTPGNMVGPEAETTGLIRHCSRLFVIGANLTVPIMSVVLRKSYGLGAIAMTGGSYQASMFAVSWPTGEFGGMGLEGAVKLGYRNELAAIEDPVERQETFDRMVAASYERGKALSQALGPALDDVIDPADTRRWILAGLSSLPPTPPRTDKKLRWIDAW